MSGGPLIFAADAHQEGQSTRRVQVIFRWLVRAILLASLLCIGYWLLASDRYVSESIVIIQNTEQLGMQTVDFTSMLGGIGGISKPD